MRDYAIQFSGGKDSLAALHLSKPIWHRATVYFGDTGGFYPHMVEFVQRTCDQLGLPLKIVKPPMSMEEYHQQYGLPSDIVPVESSIEMKPFTKRIGHILQPSMRCCATLQWRGLHQAIADDGVRHVVRGSKKADQHVGVGDGYVDERGVTYHCPVWGWTDDDVFRFLRENGMETAEHYSESNNSFDCVLCTAFLGSSGARSRLEFTKRRYPEAWPELKRRIGIVRDVIDEERAALSEALAMAED